MSEQHHPYIEWRRVPGKGRGIFARRAIPAGATIEVAPLSKFPGEISAERRRTEPGWEHVFTWEPGVSAHVWGLVALYNHSPDPNVRVDDGPEADTAMVVALRDIAAGEELCFDYGEVWFDIA